MPSELTNIFVYGTLKRGHCRAHLLEAQRFLGVATTKPCYRLYDCGSYPALVENSDGIAVEGEIWSIDDECLLTLDLVEGVHEGLYERRMIQLVDWDGDVQSYYYLQSVEHLSDCGASW